MSEFALIDSLVDRLGGARQPVGLDVHAGDDAAVFDGGPYPVVTVDTIVEGVHWDPTLSRPADVGFKLLAVNLSDMAAMGAHPGPFLLALTLGRDTGTQVAFELAEGIAEARVAHDLDPTLVVPIGGDITHTAGSQVFSLILFGREARRERLFRRGDARVGDRIWVSGPLGSAAAGLEVMRRPPPDAARFDRLAQCHRRPRARLDLVSGLTALPAVHAVIDVSDGLAGDLWHILRASEVAAEIELEALPVDPLVDEVAERLSIDKWTLVLGGGEDFELLVTADTSSDQQLGALGLSPIGRVLEGHGLTWLDSVGNPVELLVGGYEHF